MVSHFQEPKLLHEVLADGRASILKEKAIARSRCTFMFYIK